MYNYSLKLTYNDSSEDDDYRDELLQAFSIKKYDDNIVNKEITDNIIPLVEPHFKSIYALMNEQNKFPFPLDDYVCIIFLLSWEYFYLFHRCLGEIKQNKITDSITNLICELKKDK